MTEILTETATLKLFQSVHNYDGCFQDSFNLLQMISQPFINGFCFNMGHLNELQLVIRMSEYSLREEVIRIFEYSNHLLETLMTGHFQLLTTNNKTNK